MWQLHCAGDVHRHARGASYNGFVSYYMSLPPPPPPFTAELFHNMLETSKYYFNVRV